MDEESEIVRSHHLQTHCLITVVLIMASLQFSVRLAQQQFHSHYCFLTVQADDLEVRATWSYTVMMMRSLFLSVVHTVLFMLVECFTFQFCVKTLQRPHSHVEDAAPEFNVPDLAQGYFRMWRSDPVGSQLPC